MFPNWELSILLMRIISRRTLREFWEKYPDSEEQLKAWFAEARDAEWETPNELIEQFGTASILKGGKAVFNICGNKYRLVVWINFDLQIIYIKFIGTHKEYDALELGE